MVLYSTPSSWIIVSPPLSSPHRLCYQLSKWLFWPEELDGMLLFHYFHDNPPPSHLNSGWKVVVSCLSFFVCTYASVQTCWLVKLYSTCFERTDTHTMKTHTHTHFRGTSEDRAVCSMELSRPSACRQKAWPHTHPVWHMNSTLDINLNLLTLETKFQNSHRL